MATSPSDRGRPSPGELAAIVAAIEAVWPAPPGPGEVPTDRRSPGWRFSGRWWHPDNAGRRRPRTFPSK
ncbi:MAG: hypothetical protein ACRD0N_08385 [Acidimicrobiales bacterium]